MQDTDLLSDSDDELLRKEKANLEEQLAKINSQLGSKGKKRKATKQEPLDAPDPPATPATEESEALKRRGARRFDSQTSLSAEPSSRRRVRPSSAVPTSKANLPRPVAAPLRQVGRLGSGSSVGPGSEAMVSEEDEPEDESETAATKSSGKYGVVIDPQTGLAT
eukprot:s958_g7.t1